MKILFLTRACFQETGGFENLSYNLIENFKKINKNTFFISNKKKGRESLPFFFILSFLESLYLIKKHKIDYLHISDPVLAPEGFFLKLLTGVKVAVNTHGLDVVYTKFFYQEIILPFLRRMDIVICISEKTKQECLKRRISSNKCIIIPCGINPNEFQIKNKQKMKEKTLNYLSKQLGINLKNKKILLTVGRLVRRKGHEWFISNVMCKLNSNTIYLITGDGQEKENIERAIIQKGLRKRVFMLGKISDNLKIQLYNLADLFIMPNIRVEKDMEGFGIVAIEAGIAGLETIATGLEGIKDAVLDGQTGWLVKEKNAKDFIDKITGKRLNKEKISKLVNSLFSWENVVKRYYEELKKL